MTHVFATQWSTITQRTPKPTRYDKAHSSVIDRNIDAASVDGYLQDVDVREAFNIVCLDTVYDFDTVYNLRRAARRLLQVPTRSLSTSLLTPTGCRFIV